MTIGTESVDMGTLVPGAPRQLLPNVPSDAPPSLRRAVSLYLGELLLHEGDAAHDWPVLDGMGELALMTALENAEEAITSAREQCRDEAVVFLAEGNAPYPRPALVLNLVLGLLNRGYAAAIFDDDGDTRMFRSKVVVLL